MKIYIVGIIIYCQLIKNGFRIMIRNIYITTILICWALILCAMRPNVAEVRECRNQSELVSRNTSECSSITEPFILFDDSEICNELEEDTCRIGNRTVFLPSKFSRPDNLGINIFLSQFAKCYSRSAEQRNNYVILPCLRSVILRT